MSSEFKKIGLVIKPNLKEYKNVIGTLIGWLARRNKKIILLEDESERFEKKITPNSKVTFLKEKEFYKESGLIISLGGDGTLLAVCRNSNSKNYILGVNLGHLGFITEYSKHDFYDSLESIIKGTFESYKKPLFQVEIIEKEKVISRNYFINDIVIGKRGIARLVKLSIETEEDHIANIAGDGIIISSPTGSTAYSLSAGGPILHPDVNAMVITPICAHGLNHRPLVLPEKTEISIKSKDDSSLTSLTIDGQTNFELQKRYTIKVKRSGKKGVNIIKNQERNFFLTLKDKLTHGKR